MNLLSLNACGIMDSVKRNWIKEIRCNSNVNFLGIQESKAKEVNEITIQALWGSRNVGFVYKPADGLSRGLINIWDRSCFTVKDSFVGEGFIVMIGNWVGIDGDLVVANVYAPQNPIEKQKLWENLKIIRRNTQGHWLCFGDFNAIRDDSECKGIHFNPRVSREFNQFILDSELVEVPLGGRNFTRITRDGKKMSKLDRILISPDVFEFWPKIHVTALPRRYSDYSPLLLETNSEDFGPTPFKFYNVWLQYESLDQIVVSAWNNANNHSRPDISFCMKLKAIKVAVKDWYRMLRESMNSEKSNLVKQLEDLDVKADCGLLSESELNVKSEVLKRLFEIEDENTSSLKQKARCKWTIEGDENTKFFLSVINGRNRRQSIHGVMLNGNWITNPSLIKQFFYDSFSSRFKEVLVTRPRFESQKFKKITESERLNLERPFEMPEVKKAVWDCGSEKSLGPDGFSFKFIKHYWELIGEEILQAIKFFGSSCSIAKGCNSSFISLIPKKLDSSLFGFWFSSVLVNGSPTPEFKLSKGLREGDPLSPFLFIIAIEALHIAMLEAREKHISKVASGLKVNLSKSRLIGVGPGEEEARMLSFGGRLVLIKSVISNLPVYFFSLYRAPCKVLKSLDRIRMNFFWGGGVEDKKIAWISWKDAIAPLNQGGIGIGSLDACNISLLAKWWWRWKIEDLALWKQVIHAIHGSIEGESIKKKSKKETVNFWKDDWLGDFNLASMFPRLYTLEIEKDSPLSERLLQVDGSQVWNWNWRRDLRSGRETTEFGQLTELVQDVKLSNLPDSWRWSLEKSGKFTVKSLRSRIEKQMFQNHNHFTRWSKLVPKKVNILVWRAGRGRLATRVNLDSRNIDLHTILCPMCDSETKSTEHLMVSCSWSNAIWNKPKNKSFFEPLQLKCFEAVLFSSAWIMWRSRNRKVFTDKSQSSVEVFKEIQQLSFNWISGRGPSCSGSTTRQESVVPQPRSPTQTLVAYEAASTGVDVRYRGATTTVTGLEAGQGSVQSLETDLKQTKQIYGAAYTRLIKKVKNLYHCLLTLSFSSEIFKSLSFRLDRLCHLAILCLDQHAHTLHHLESLLTISLDRLDIFEGRSCISEFVRKSLSLILELS
ncbi:RNA-directed DNA polymerase, eukaryota [Tanacetum coccineum]